GTRSDVNDAIKSSTVNSCGENTGLSMISDRYFLKYRIARLLGKTTVKSPGVILSPTIRSASSFRNGFTKQNYQRITGKKYAMARCDSICQPSRERGV